MKHSKKWDRCVRKVKRARRAVDPYAVCTSALKKRPRKRDKNPRLQNMFIILAVRGPTVLKYTGRNRFASKGRAVLYPSRAAASYEARELKDKYAAALRGYRLRVTS